MRRTRGLELWAAKNSRQLASCEMRSLNGHAASETNFERVDGDCTFRLIILSYHCNIRPKVSAVMTTRLSAPSET
jgi:hypothetical protein